MAFKRGDKVKCIKGKNCVTLTEGNTYIVTQGNHWDVTLEGKGGRWYTTSRFELCKDTVDDLSIF